MVEMTKRSDAAAPAADLAAFFRTMRLEDPPSPSPPPEPLQVPVRESSAAAEYTSILGSRSPSSFFASNFAPSSPRFNTLAAGFLANPATLPLVSPLPSMPSSSTNHHCQPMPSAFHRASSPASDHSLGLNQYTSAPTATMPAGLSHNVNLINLYAGHTQPRSSAFPAACYDNAGRPGINILNPYASARPAATPTGHSVNPFVPAAAMHAANHLSYYPPRAGVSAARRVPTTLVEVWWRLLSGPMDPALVMSKKTAPHVLCLLHERGEEVRRSVLAGVVCAVHRVMESREGRDVFIALLLQCSVRVDELRYLVDAVCIGEDVLTSILKQDHGVKCLESLITVVAPYTGLSRSLIFWLFRERLTESCKGGLLVNQCFAMMPYEVCSIVIRFAIGGIETLLLSASGSVFLAECFVNARNGELLFLEEFILSRTTDIAMGQYSNYFMQRALECGSEGLKERIAERVAAEVATLAADKFGSYVVEACFQQTFSLAPMELVLRAFVNLPTEQLAELVQGEYSNYVVQKLLKDGKRDFRRLTVQLARRIVELPAPVKRDMHARSVIQVVQKEKLFRRTLDHY